MRTASAALDSLASFSLANDMLYPTHSDTKVTWEVEEVEQILIRDYNETTKRKINSSYVRMHNQKSKISLLRLQ